MMMRSGWQQSPQRRQGAGVRNAVAATLVLAVAVLAAPALDARAAAPKYDWDRVANVKEAARQIGEIQAAQGADKAFQFINACYKTHSLASAYSKYFEGCIAQDLMLMEALAAIYSRADAGALRRAGAPTVEQLQRSLNQRIGGAYATYNIPPAEVQSLKKIVDTHGMPVFLKVLFPPDAPATPKKP
jgi:hypothetical protein